MRVSEARKKLEELSYNVEGFSKLEFYNYMTGETPTGDVYTLENILENEYLMLHEVVEISELKKKDVPIDKQTIMKFHPKVYEAHLTAAEYELTYAFNRKNYDWIKLRLKHAKDWLEDEYLPHELLPQCKYLIERFSKLVRSKERRGEFME